MPPSIALRAIDIATQSADSEARLLLIDDRLVGVLVRLEDEVHPDELRGGWFLEAAFGALAGYAQRTFATLDEAAAWALQIWPGP